MNRLRVGGKTGAKTLRSQRLLVQECARAEVPAPTETPPEPAHLLAERGALPRDHRRVTPPSEPVGPEPAPVPSSAEPGPVPEDLPGGWLPPVPPER